MLDEAYWLNRLIFEGGMGTVYEAIHMRLRKRVAVKVMVSELAETAEGLARFRREVEVTSQLSHPHVIQLLDFGTTPAGPPYLVMEYLDGEDLEHRLKRVGRLSLPAAVDVFRQVASALTVIHGKGSCTAISSRPTCSCCRSRPGKTSSRWSTSASRRSQRPRPS